jgi:hypothetical protein
MSANPRCALTTQLCESSVLSSPLSCFNTVKAQQRLNSHQTISKKAWLVRPSPAHAAHHNSVNNRTAPARTLTMAAVDVAPEELRFRFVLGKQMLSTMTVTNSSPQRVAFKVKTTAPKKYVVRPSSGVVEANSTQAVQVIMQAQVWIRWFSCGQVWTGQEAWLVLVCRGRHRGSGTMRIIR